MNADAELEPPAADVGETTTTTERMMSKRPVSGDESTRIHAAAGEAAPEAKDAGGTVGRRSGADAALEAKSFPATDNLTTKTPTTTYFR